MAAVAAVSLRLILRIAGALDRRDAGVKVCQKGGGQASACKLGGHRRRFVSNRVRAIDDNLLAAARHPKSGADALRLLLHPARRIAKRPNLFTQSGERGLLAPRGFKPIGDGCVLRAALLFQRLHCRADVGD